MHFLQWLRSVPRWDAIGWLVIVAIGSYWEIDGAFFRHRTTFTELVRSVVPVWVRAGIMGLVVYHFLIDPKNFK